MPTFRDIEVHITDNKNVPLAEWGVRKRDTSRQSWCYIQSETNMPFRVLVKPKLPYPAFGSSEPERREPAGGRRASPTYEPYEKPAERRDDFEGMRSLFRDDLSKQAAPYLPQPQPPAPWHLLVTMRLDGRQAFEKRAILYLDVKHPNCLHFQPNGLIMSTRTQTDEHGHLVECGWLFKEVGVETVFDQLLLSAAGGEQAVPAKNEDELIAAFDGLAADHMNDEQENTVGQIEITMDRITLGKESSAPWTRHRQYDQDYDENSLDPKDLAKATHSVARDAGRRKSSMMNWIHYDLLDSPKKPFATFKFYYRHEDKLRKFGFPGFPPKATAKTKRERMTAMDTVAGAPLSILKPSSMYIMDDEGMVFAVQDPPPLPTRKKAKQSTSEDADSGELWIPKNNKLADTAPVARTYEPLETPPASPTRSESDESSYSPPRAETDVEQSSADGVTPVKALPLPPPSFSAHVDLRNRFRMMDDSITEGEEADDEASGGEETETDGEDEEEVGISEDRPDEGLGEGLGKIELGSKRRGEEEEQQEVAKKSRFEGEGEGDAGTEAAIETDE